MTNKLKITILKRFRPDQLFDESSHAYGLIGYYVCFDWCLFYMLQVVFGLFMFLLGWEDLKN